MSRNEGWHSRLLRLLLMCSNQRPDEERERERLANELLEEWLAPRPLRDEGQEQGEQDG